MLYLNVMSRIEGRKDDMLLMDVAQKIGRPAAFPTMAWMDAAGEPITGQGGRAVKDFQKTADLLNKRIALKKKADAGDEAAKVELAFLECELGMIDFDELEDAVDVSKLTDEQKKAFERLKNDSEIDAMFAVINAQRGSETSIKTAGKVFLEMHKKGVKPSAENKQVNFYVIIFRYGLITKDAATANAGLDQMAERLKDNERAMQWIENQRSAVKKMEEDAKTDACGAGCGDGCGG